MKEKLLAFLRGHYLRYHDVLFYLITLGVIVVSTHFALQITREKDEQDFLNSQTRDIPAVHYTIKQKPIYQALNEAGLDKKAVTEIVAKLSTLVNTRRLQPKDTYTLSVEGGQLVMLMLTQGFKHYYVANIDGTLITGVSEAEIKTRVKSAAGKIQGSLFNTMLKDGLQTSLILDFTDAFSWTIDFNTDTRNGDEYTALWEENFAPNGEIISQDLLAASYKHVYEKKPTYAFYFEDDFFDETGKISKKMFLKSPISFRGYRISSRFNPSRMHPVLKIRRPHLGIDFAAPVGTPVQAVADGVVKFAGWKGGYGNFVELKHPNNFTTTYGHLKGYGKGIKAGNKVKQGQVVGYIGSTGLSTGPHLDFRIKEGNKFLDFLKMKNRNSSVRDVPAEKKEEFEALKKLYLKELDSAQQADVAGAIPAAAGEQHETEENSLNGRPEQR